MANSIGGAAAQGIESGLGMGLRLFDQQEQIRSRQQREQEHATDRQERRADRDLQNQRALKQDERLAAQDARQVKQDERQTTLDGLKLMDADLAELTNEGTALFSQYGGYDKVPEDVRGDYTTRVRTARQRRADARRKVYEPTLLEQKRDAAEKWSRIQTGQLNVDDMPDDDLVKTLTVMSRRDLNDFMAPKEGGPSKIQQAGMDLQAGIETGNMDLTLKAANVLLAPELRTGVGTDGRDGSEIVGKEIVQLVPHPQDPSRVVPVVKVTVRREDGALGSYVAPITEGRSSDPNDNVKTISMQEAFDRVGQLTTLAEALNRPDVRKRIEKGRETAGTGPDEFLQALSSVGVKAPAKKVSYSNVPGRGAAPTIRIGVDESGNEVSRERFDYVKPPGGGSGDDGDGGGGRGLGLGLRGASGLTGEDFLKTLSADDARIVKGLADGSIKQEAISTKGNRRERMLAMTKQYQADADMGSKAGKLDSPKDKFEAENKLRDEYQKASGSFTKIRDAYGLVQAAAKDPSAAGDMSLIFAYMRILDPNSVVREGEFLTAQQAAALPDRVRGAYERVVSGQRLAPDQRKDFVNQAKKVYAEQKKGQNRLDKNYTELAHRYGLDAENVVQKFDLEDGAPQLPPEVSAQLKEGQVTTFRNGQRWMLQGGQPVQVQ